MTREPQDDELLRSYLLGDLPDEDAERLERRLLVEDELFDLAEAVEADLLAALSVGGLAPAERERVLRRLASSPRGRERLALAQSLNAVADESRTAARNVLPFSRPATAFPPPAIHWIALAASLVMLAGLGWFAWQHREQAPAAASRVAVQTPMPTPPPPAPQPTPPRPATSPTAKLPRPNPGHRTPRKEPRSAIAVLALSLRDLRGAEAEPVEQLHLSPATRTVEIQIFAEGLDDAGGFTVAVRSGDQGTVWEKTGIKPTALRRGSALIVRVPAERLAAGRYEVAVTAPGESGESAKEFEVVAGKR